MRKVLSFAIAVLFLFQCFALCANANPYVSYLGNELEAFPQCSDEIVSSDGKYGYVFNEETGDCYFSHSFEKNITVLNIPEEIDGHKIVGVIDGKAESCFTIVEVNYSKNIKDIYRGGMTFSLMPNCRINLNEGLETIHRRAFWPEWRDYYYYAVEPFDELIFPSTLKEIKADAITPTVRRLVFQSDPVVDMTAHELDLEICFNGNTPHFKKDIYFTGNAENVEAYAFGIMSRGDEVTEGTFGYPVYYNLTIYHKPGASGFEKFETAGAVSVEEYTREIWKETVSGVPVESIGVDNVTVKLPMPDDVVLIESGNAGIKIEASITPENATDKRVWFYSMEPQKFEIGRYGFISPLRNYDRLEGQTVTVRAVASNGVYTDFEIQFVKDEPTAKSQPATDGNTLTAGGAIENIRAFFSDIFNAVLNFFSNVIKTVKGFFVK